MGLRFEWDPQKAAANERDHRVSFAEAITAFDDPYSVSVPDPDHSADEERWLLLGRSKGRRLLIVSHTERGDALRLISARLATRAERKTYEEEPA